MPTIGTAQGFKTGWTGKQGRIYSFSTPVVHHPSCSRTMNGPMDCPCHPVALEGVERVPQRWPHQPCVVQGQSIKPVFRRVLRFRYGQGINLIRDMTRFAMFKMSKYRSVGPKRRNPALRDREIAQDIDLMIDRRDPAERPDSRFIRTNSPGRGPRPRRRRGKRRPKETQPGPSGPGSCSRHRSNDRQTRSGREAGQSLYPG